MLKPKYDIKSSPMPRIVEGLSRDPYTSFPFLCRVSVGFSVCQEVVAHLLTESVPRKTHCLAEPSCTWRDLQGEIRKDKQQPRAARPPYIFINTVTLLLKQYSKSDTHLPHCFPPGLGAKPQALSQLTF